MSSKVSSMFCPVCLLSAEMTSSSAVLEHKVLHSDGVADRRIVGTIDNGVDTTVLVAETTGSRTISGDNRTPDWGKALGSCDGVAVQTGP